MTFVAAGVFTLAPGCVGPYTPVQPLAHTHNGAPASEADPGTGGDAQANINPPPKRGLEAEWPKWNAHVSDPKVVNVFGEIDGVPRSPGKMTGDAGFQQHTYTDEGADSDVAVDPMGKWIAFASTRHSEHTDIYVQRVDGTSVTELTSDAADDAYPCFSPDGKAIAFASTRAGSWQIYVMDTDGRNVTQVTNSSLQCIHPSFSPDGGRLVYSAIGSRSNQWELWTADLRSGEKRMIGYGLFPRWSPDRTVDRIVYQKARQRGGRWFSIWTLDLIEGEGRRMTEVVASTNAAVVSPAWSPDGRRLVFATVVEPVRAPGATARTERWGTRGTPRLTKRSRPKARPAKTGPSLAANRGRRAGSRMSGPSMPTAPIASG